jgi:hypothetical protein
VTACGNVTGAAPEGSRKRYEAWVWCETAEGKKIVAGTASALSE